MVYVYNTFRNKRKQVIVLPEEFEPEMTLAGTKLFWNLNWKKTVVTMFPQFPTTVLARKKPLSKRKCYDSLTMQQVQANHPAKKPQYEGMDAEVLKTLAAKLRFIPSVQLPKGTPDHGIAEADGKASGAIADVMTGLSQMALNARYVKDPGTREVKFVQPTVGESRVCVLVPRAGLVPFYRTAVLSFSSTVNYLFLPSFIKAPLNSVIS